MCDLEYTELENTEPVSVLIAAVWGVQCFANFKIENKILVFLGGGLWQT